MQGRQDPLALGRMACLSLAMLSLLLVSVVAIYEDQAGVVDWHMQQLGKVEHAIMQKKRVFVGTSSNVLASVGLRTGAIAWRHVLEEEDRIDSVALLGRLLLTLSGEGKFIRAWNAQDGSTVWEQVVYTGDEAYIGEEGPSLRGAVDLVLLPEDADDDGLEDFAVIVGGYVQVRSAMDGSIIWTTDVVEKGGQMMVERLFYVPSSQRLGSGQLVAGGFQLEGYNPDEENYEITATALGLVLLDAQTGDFEKLIIHPAPEGAGGFRTGSLNAAGSAQFACIDASGSLLVSVALDGQTSQLHTSNLANIISPSSCGTGARVYLRELRASGGSSIAVARGTEAVSIVNLKPGEAPAEVYRAAASTCLSDSPATSIVISDAIAPSSGKSWVAGITTMSDAGVALTVVDVESGEELHQEVFPGIAIEERRGTDLVSLASYSRKDGSTGYRMLMFCVDQSLILAQQEEVVWVREEALASIEHSGFVDLPLQASSAFDDMLHAPSPSQRLRRQILNLKYTLRLATPEEKQELLDIRRSNPEKTLPYRDHNGFRKLLYVMSRAGKLFALHSGQGKLLWSKFLFPLPSAKITDVKVIHFETRAGHEGASPEILVILHLGETSRALWIEGYSGSIVRTKELPFAIRHVLSLGPAGSAADAHVRLLVDSDLKVHCLEDDPASLESTHALLPTTFFYEILESSASLIGYGIYASSRDVTVFDTVEVWSVLFPHESERIVAAAAPAHQAVHTEYRVLGNRDVLKKYINPNMLFVATLSESKDAATLSTADSFITAYILDTVTGSILYKLVHEGSRGPVHAVLCENFVVYYYWNIEMMRNEMSVLEMFDDSPEKTHPMIATIFGAEERSISSFAIPPLRVLGQSYFIGPSVKAMTVSGTLQGITSKQIILGTVSDQVLAMDKKFLDPRRPVKASKTDREEGLIQYSPHLPIIPHNFVSYNLQVANLRKIWTSPARLESTSHLLAVGIDLFYTRIMPSKSYDIIAEDFNYVLLVVTVVALTCVAVALGTTVNRRNLERKWK